jgi:hypothetical protein
MVVRVTLTRGAADVSSSGVVMALATGDVVTTRS